MKFLQGSKVYLRPIDANDTDTYFSMLFHSETRRLTGTQKCFTRESVRHYIESKSRDQSSILLLIGLQEKDQIIGDIQLLDIDTINRNCYIRISIDNNENQGKGYGTEAMKLMLDYAFGILNLHRVELNVFTYNQKAVHVYEKLGFKKEGIQREALFYDHYYHDSIIMSILKHEYRQQYIDK
ncbi:GNAT family N-acetyltransferase [Shimazuella sp. AN120528]|uniref:GNAT family N-acetyltransferase n=1 Tax=Shimazuella soli TaxID=1892854 RepID=UPI001F111715|nr:GNAT family protein [Shimazuella soli]MCH5584598.1 GNAT family N-acetyltransferase [Shimazuella soli]